MVSGLCTQGIQMPPKAFLRSNEHLERSRLTPPGTTDGLDLKKQVVLRPHLANRVVGVLIYGLLGLRTTGQIQ
jgi:hypothetical protein